MTYMINMSAWSGGPPPKGGPADLLVIREYERVFGACYPNAVCIADKASNLPQSAAAPRCEGMRVVFLTDEHDACGPLPTGHSLARAAT